MNVKERMDEVGMLEVFHRLLPYRKELIKTENEVKEWIKSNEEEVQSPFTVGNLRVSKDSGHKQDVDPDSALTSADIDPGKEPRSNDNTDDESDRSE